MRRAKDFRFHPGDLLACYGDGLLSRAIEWATWGPSHVAQVYADAGNVLVYESTSLCRRPCLVAGRVVEGVQVHRPHERVEDYGGRVEVWRPVPVWAWKAEQAAEVAQIVGYYTGAEAQHYDFLRATLSATTWFKRCFYPDAGSKFCSELIAMVLQRICWPVTGNPAYYTPGGLVRQLRRLGLVRKVPVPWGER